MGSVGTAIAVGVECLGAALLLTAIWLELRALDQEERGERAQGDWMVRFHERIWEPEEGEHGGATADCPEG